MNRDSILTSPSYAHQGEFLASGTIWNLAGCIVDTASTETTSSEGVPLLQNKLYLKQIDAASDAADGTVPVYFAYKWPTNDDYLERNGQSYQYITDGEPVIGLRAMSGIKVQTYVGTDYTNASGVKMGMAAPGITWSSVSYGTALYFTDDGQLTTATTNTIVRAHFLELNGSWITVELTDPYHF